MKIRIEINQMEKDVIVDVFHFPLKDDNTVELVKGKFGFIKVTSDFIEFELKPTFVTETLISIKTLVAMFIGNWFDKVESETLDKDGNKLVKVLKRNEGESGADLLDNAHEREFLVKEYLVEMIGDLPPETEDGREVVGIVVDNKLKYAYLNNEDTTTK